MQHNKQKNMELSGKNLYWQIVIENTGNCTIIVEVDGNTHKIEVGTTALIYSTSQWSAGTYSIRFAGRTVPRQTDSENTGGACKTKKKHIIISAVLLTIILTFCGILKTTQAGYSRVLNANWGIKLPPAAHCSEIYESNAGASFNGDGLRYHVFSYENSTAIEHLLEWSEDDQSTIFYSTQIEAAKNWLMDLNVPDEWKPDYENSRYYYCSHNDNSELIIVWNAENKLLHVVESFL